MHLLNHLHLQSQAVTVTTVNTHKPTILLYPLHVHNLIHCTWRIKSFCIITYSIVLLLYSLHLQSHAFTVPAHKEPCFTVSRARTHTHTNTHTHTHTYKHTNTASDMKSALQIHLYCMLTSGLYSSVHSEKIHEFYTYCQMFRFFFFNCNILLKSTSDCFRF